MQGLDLRPATATTPIVNLDPDPADGPVLVTVSYRVPGGAHVEFVEMMRRVERDRRRSGATSWGLYRDLADTDRFLETFEVDTWGEHLRQHERRTRTADVMMQRAREFVEGDIEVAHLVDGLQPERAVPGGGGRRRRRTVRRRSGDTWLTSGAYGRRIRQEEGSWGGSTARSPSSRVAPGGRAGRRRRCSAPKAPRS